MQLDLVYSDWGQSSLEPPSALNWVRVRRGEPFRTATTNMPVTVHLRVTDSLTDSGLPNVEQQRVWECEPPAGRPCNLAQVDGAILFEINEANDPDVEARYAILQIEWLASDEEAALRLSASYAFDRGPVHENWRGIQKLMTRIGSALVDQLDAAEVERLADHTSDTVRGWVCFLHATRSTTGPAALLSQLRRFADDEHFSVREWAWMAARPTLTSNLEASIKLLAGFTGDSSERVRRFASEALRPRGVWAAHIPALKQQPERGEPILHPLRADPPHYT